MDSPPDTARSVLDSEREDPGGGNAHAGTDDDSDATAGRDIRDVLRQLVVLEGDESELSLSAVAEAAASTDRFVPELLSALDSESTAVRVGAAWTLCALADDQPAAVEYLATNLANRVDEGPFEVGQTFAYLKGRYPGRVAEAVDMAVELDGPGEDDATPDPEAPAERDECPGRVADAHGRRVETDGGVPAGTVADLGDGRQVVRPNHAGSGATHTRPVGPPGPTGPTGSRPSPSSDPPTGHPTHPDFDPPDADTPDTPGPTSDSGTGSAPPEPIGPEATPDTFAAIAALSSLDRLSAVDRGVEARYAEGYRCRAERDGTEQGVAVRLFDRPEDADRLAFRGALEDTLAAWETVADRDGVVDVAEWGLRPRPWVRTRAVDASLADRGAPDPASAVDQAVDLAVAVATLHTQGIVHGGLDPKNVVYPCDIQALDRPLVDNVGLMAVFREYFEPANYLDPRFAPPEYFDDEFGAVDAGTDVYGLGAVVYYLATGRPPFDGSYSEVRQGVLSERPPAPSDVSAGAPPRLDAVLGKALAKRKLRRYDDVEAFRRDLKQVRDGV